MRRHVPMLVALGFGMGFAAPPRQAASPQSDPLAPVLFLVGRWTGEGTSTYGPYRFRTEITRRGRWLLGMGEAQGTQQGAPLIQTASVMGYDEAGRLVFYLFDGGGAWRFLGTADSSGVTFEWREGEAFRRTRIDRQPDGTFRQRTQAHLPNQRPPLPVDVTLESVSRPEP